jgi:predicted small lipoprotein YifL
VRRLAAALALVALAGCGHGGTPPARQDGTPSQRSTGARPPTDHEQLQALLDRRAKALLDGRVGARLGLRDVRMRLSGERIHGRRATLRVATAWGVRGVRGTFLAARTMTAERRATGWRITGVHSARAAPPWEVADYRQRRLAHFTVFAPRGLDVDAAGLPATLAAGYAAIRTALPRATLRRRYLVVVAPTAGAAHRLTTDIRGVGGLAAISDTAVREAGPAKRVSAVTSQRLLVVWPAFAALGEDDRRRVVAHELTHAVLAEATSGRTPGWLVEGIALYTSGDARADRVAAALDGRAGAAGVTARSVFSLRGLSAPDSIARLRGARQAGAYAYASAATFTLVARHGRRALAALYDSFNDESLAGRPGPALVDRALRRTIGEGLDAFEAEVRDAAAAAAAGTSGTSTRSVP